MKGAGRVRQVVRDEVPPVGAVGASSAEPGAQVMGRPVGQLPGRVDDRCEKKRVPGGFPFRRNRMSAWLQGKSDRRGASVLAAEQVGVVRIGHMVDVYQVDSRLSQAVVDRMVGSSQVEKGTGRLACFSCVKRSSSAAATTVPARTRQA